MANNTTFKFAAIQLAVTADKENNLKNAAEKIKEAASNGAKVVSLPECFNCPYGNQYFPTYAESIGEGPTAKMLAQAAIDNKVYLVGGSFPEREGEKLYNTSLTFSPEGKVLTKHRKVHLFDINIPGKMVFQESETLSPGNTLSYFDTEFCRIGVAICYDVRFAELAQLSAQMTGCKVLCYPGAFNMTTGPAHWELLLRARALDNQVYVAGVSPARDEKATYIAWGHSTIVNPWGEVVAKASAEAAIIYADIALHNGEEGDMEVPLLPSPSLITTETLNTTQDNISSQNTVEESTPRNLASSQTQIEKSILANSTDSVNSISESSRAKHRCSICGMIGHTAGNKKFHHVGRTEDEEVLEDILPKDIDLTLVTRIEGKKGANIATKLLKWAKNELGYVPRELASSMKLHDRYRLVVNTDEDMEKIANKEFEYEDLKFTFKPASDLAEIHKKRQELTESVSKQNEGLEYNCRCGDPTPTVALAGDPVDLRCAICTKMFHQKCTECNLAESPLPGDWAYEFLCKQCNFAENKILTDSFSFQIKDSESILLIALYNMHLEAIQERRLETDFFHESEISDFIEEHFDALCYYKPKKSFVGKPMPDILRMYFQNTEIFKAGHPECWGLVHYENPLLTHTSPRKKPKKKPASVIAKEMKAEEDYIKKKRGRKRKLPELSTSPPPTSVVSPPVTPAAQSSPSSPSSSSSGPTRPPLSFGNSFSSVTTFPPPRPKEMVNNSAEMNDNLENERVFSASGVVKKRKMNGKVQYLLKLREEGVKKDHIRVWFSSEQLSIMQNEEETVVINPPPPPPPPPPPKPQTEDDLEEISAAKMVEGQLNFLVKWKGHETHTFVPASILNKVAPMAVIQFYESRVSFDKPKATRPKRTNNNNENGKLDQDEITTNLALQLIQQQKLQQQIISQLLHSRPPMKTKTTNNNNEKTSAASGTKVIPCTGCNVLLQYHVNARQIQCPRCKTTMMLDNSNTVTVIDVEKS